MSPPLDPLIGVAIGLAIGMIGTLIGAGGGFMLVPLLLFLHPDWPPRAVAAVSMAVVFANAASGSVAYLRMKRVDTRAATWFACAALPGAALGAWLVTLVSRSGFEIAMSAVLGLIGLLLLVRAVRGRSVPEARTDAPLPMEKVYRGALASTGVGVLSSMLGIGGGIIHVPLLVQWLKMPVHRATATSHLVLAMTALVAVLFGVASGSFAVVWPEAIWIGLGAVIGAQVGARASKIVPARAVMGVLGAALLAVALRLAVRQLMK